VPQPKPSSVITLNLNPPALRWLMVFPMLLVIAAAWFTTRWYVGNTVAEYAPPIEQGGADMAQLAVRWAPNDPLTHWRLGALKEKVFSPENLAAAANEYKLAVEAAPYDYRYWMEYGRALEATGDIVGAEKALRRSVELAPEYARPRWVYGNFLLRQERIDEAFDQLSRAANADELMRPQVFTLAWQIFNGDLDKIVKAVPSPAVRLQFVVYLINTGGFDEAARVLRSVNEADRRAQSDLTDEIVKTLITKKQFHAALTILREVETDPTQLPTPEKIWNGGFEMPLAPKDPRPFHWALIPTGLAPMSIDTEAHNGKGSLKIVFKAPGRLETIPISQTIIVEPDTQYRLQFYQRTADLVGAASPVVAVLDSSDNSALISSPALQTGTHDWQQVTLDFKTKKTDGVLLGFYRGSCGDGQPICPIFGTVWYDEFNLQRIGGSGPRK
jgi:tetratricopeptide (TPR) repeat protein